MMRRELAIFARVVEVEEYAVKGQKDALVTYPREVSSFIKFPQQKTKVSASPRCS